MISLCWKKEIGKATKRGRSIQKQVRAETARVGNERYLRAHHECVCVVL
uniref:Uncharacterized protein n=1 Tax=Arundo donax TaxID=35708 RepID=A0A0A9ESF9_ARUDO